MPKTLEFTPETRQRPMLPQATSTPLLRLGGLAAIALALLVGWLMRAPYLTNPCHDDLRYYVGWAYRMRTYGLGTVYGAHLREKVGAKEICLMRGDNPVGHMAIFYAVGRWLYPAIVGAPLTLERAVAINREPDAPEKRAGRAAFKLPAVLADLVTVAFLGLWTLRRYGPWHAAVVSILHALHPAVIHNSAQWGQIDVWHSLFLAAGVALLDAGWITTGAVLTASALLFKFQAIALVPLAVLALALAPAAGEMLRVHWRRMGVGLAAFATIVLVAWLPWILTGAGASIVDPYDRAIGQYGFATLNTFNLWWLVNDWPDPKNIDFFQGILDREPAFTIPGTDMGLSYRVLGILLCGTVAAILCWQLLRARFTSDAILKTALSLYLTMFLLATEMHERYLYAAVPLVLLSYRPTLGWWLTAFTIGAAATLNQVLFYPPPGGTWIARLTEWAQSDIARTGDIVAGSLLGLLTLLILENRLTPFLACKQPSTATIRATKQDPLRVAA